MAEEAAHQKVGLKGKRLSNIINTVKQALNQATDTTPTKSFLGRQLATMKEVWTEYKDVTLKLIEVARPENQQALQRAFDKADVDYTAQRDAAKAHLERIRVPDEEEPVDYTAIALDNKRQLNHLFEAVEEGLVDANADAEKPPTDALQCHLESLLKSDDRELEVAFLLTNELAELELDQTETHYNTHQVKKKDILARVCKCRSKMSSTPVPGSRSSSSPSHSIQSSSHQDNRSQLNPCILFQKQSFPKFSKKQRIYIGLWKEWKEIVAPTQNEYQFRQIRLAVPTQIQPNIKNLKNMKKVWEVLDEDFGQILKKVSGLV